VNDVETRRALPLIPPHQVRAVCRDIAGVATDHALLAEKFTVIAPDLPGIGDSSIPAQTGMLIAARQIHQLARLLHVEKARVVGHDIGLMVAYAYAAQFPNDTEKFAVMDAFLPGVEGWEAIIRPSARSSHRSQLCKAGLERPIDLLTGYLKEQLQMGGLRHG
jgi:pimeloyl-ACP methyl ester carboxylesterase